MEYRTLGRTEERVSVLGFGGTGVAMRNYLSEWDPEEQTEASGQAIARAVALGVNYFDTEALYGRGTSERLFGQALRPHRDDIFLATKARESKADEVRRSVDESLERLQTDRIDLLQYHGEWITDDIYVDIMKSGGTLDVLRCHLETFQRSEPSSELVK